jgi:hypothetical protein
MKTRTARFRGRSSSPIGIKAIQIFLEINKRLAKEPQAQKDINKETLKIVYENEIKKSNTILQRRF